MTLKVNPKVIFLSLEKSRLGSKVISDHFRLTLENNPKSHFLVTFGWLRTFGVRGLPGHASPAPSLHYPMLARAWHAAWTYCDLISNSVVTDKPRKCGATPFFCLRCVQLSWALGVETFALSRLVCCFSHSTFFHILLGGQRRDRSLTQATAQSGLVW